MWTAECWLRTGIQMVQQRSQLKTVDEHLHVSLQYADRPQLHFAYAPRHPALTLAVLPDGWQCPSCIGKTQAMNIGCLTLTRPRALQSRNAL